MRFNSLTIDNFYSNPMDVREFALRQEFKVRGNYPGQRTESFLNDNREYPNCFNSSGVMNS
jgi:hypothetical protein